MTSDEQVVTGTVERASGTGWRVLRSRFDNAQLVEDVVILIDSDGPDRGREHYDQRVELPATVFVRVDEAADDVHTARDRKSTRLNSSHVAISYAVFCLKKKNKHQHRNGRRVETKPA